MVIGNTGSGGIAPDILQHVIRSSPGERLESTLGDQTRRGRRMLPARRLWNRSSRWFFGRAVHWAAFVAAKRPVVDRGLYPTALRDVHWMCEREHGRR
jgi:hypothetical protein